MSLLDLIVEKRPEILRIAAKHGARDLRLFGSVARGEDHEGSDVDLLAGVPSWGEQLRLMGELGELLGTKVEVIADPPLPEYRERILAEAIPLDAPDFKEQAVLQSLRPRNPLERDYERLHQMLKHCEQVLKRASLMTREMFLSDEFEQYGFVKLLEIICEYAGRLSPEFKEEHPEFDWGSMAAFRNIAVRDYFRLQVEKVWDGNIEVDIPKLKAQLEQLI
jgi:uncharacterized protein